MDPLLLNNGTKLLELLCYHGNGSKVFARHCPDDTIINHVGLFLEAVFKLRTNPMHYTSLQAVSLWCPLERQTQAC
jgi:hypothetical protein